MFCKNCGSNIPDGTTFCPNCGAAQDVAPQQPQQPQYAQPQYAQPQQPVQGGIQPAAPGSPNVLVMGILAICFACTFYLSFLGIIFGAISLSKAKLFANMNGGIVFGKDKVGRILGLVGMILGIVLTAILAIVVIVFIIGSFTTAAASAISPYSYYGW